MDLPSSGTLFPKEQHYYERVLTLAEFIEHIITASPTAPCYLAYTRAEDLFPASDYDFSPLTGGYASRCGHPSLDRISRYPIDAPLRFEGQFVLPNLG
jgi:hypothetical protein